jgi:hypothetical protein
MKRGDVHRDACAPRKAATNPRPPRPAPPRRAAGPALRPRYLGANG